MSTRSLLKRPLLKRLSVAAAMAATVAALLPVMPADAQSTRTRPRADDAYRPGPDQPGLGVLNGDRADLPPDARLRGPAIVEEDFSTTVVAADQSFAADELGNLVVSLGEEKRHAA